MNRSNSVFARHRAYLLASGALVLAAGIFAGSANAEDFVVAQPSDQTNGGNTIDDDDKLTITSTGSITTRGSLERGVDAGDGNMIINDGHISTAGGDARGIDVHSGNQIINSGSISTEGTTGVGIRAFNENAITNSGSISTTKAFARGIEVLNDNKIITSGIISTAGQNAHGIAVNEGNEVINSGRISTDGQNARGIQASRGNRIINSGSITTTGAGITAETDNSVTNSGLVVATNGTAFILTAGNTLNLFAPSFIGGRIFLTDTGNTVNITTGASHSVLWEIDGVPNVNGAPNVTGSVASFFNVGTGQFATLDPTGFAAAYDSLGDMTGQLANVGRQGLSGHLSSGYGAAYGMKDNDSDPAIAYGRGLWVTPFGGKSRHEGDASTLDRDITQVGIAAGYRWQQQPGLGLGVMAGYVSDESEASSRFAKSHDGEANGFFAGLNGRKQWGNLFLDFALMGGVMAHDQDRFVNDNLAALGVSFAKASFDSRFITPEAGLSMSFDAGHGLSITPGARVRYAAQWLDGYTETGSRANASVEDRMLGLVEANAEIAVSQLFGFGSITGRLGILGRSSTGDGEVAVSLIDVSNTVAFSARDDVAGYVGLSASIKADDNLKLDLDGQAIFGEDFTGVQGMARIIQRF